MKLQEIGNKVFQRIVIRKIGIGIIALGLVACAEHKSQQAYQADASTGIVNGEVVGAKDALADSVVALYLDETSEEGRPLTQLCTGTLIDAHTVLTAAHCLDKNVAINAKSILVAFGRKVIKTQADLATATLRKGLKKIVHPKWNPDEEINPQRAMYDIGLISFEGDAPEGLKPIAYAQSTDEFANNTKLVTYGFGLINGLNREETDSLRKAPIKITNWKYSATHFRSSDVTSTCSGDSGGPAFVVDANSGAAKVVGITSFGPMTCLKQSFFTRVPVFAAWVGQSVKALAQ